MNDDAAKAVEAAEDARWEALCRLTDLVCSIRALPEDTPGSAVDALGEHLENLLDEVIETHQMLVEIIGNSSGISKEEEA